MKDLQDNRTLAKAILVFVLWCHAAVSAVLAFFYLSRCASCWIEVVGYSTLGAAGILVLVLSNVGLLRGSGGDSALGIANRLTVVRFILVVPILALIADGRLIPALVLYVMSGLTDVADGVLARRRREETRFGVVMDPLADILTTAGVFWVLSAKGLVPWWVFAVLMARYVSLGLGSVVLHLWVGPIEFKATPTGKIVGVLQTCAVILVLTLTAAGFAWQARVGGLLYPFLAMIFVSVIVSQLVIAVRHVKKGTGHAGSQRRPDHFSADLGDADGPACGGDG